VTIYPNTTTLVMLGYMLCTKLRNKDGKMDRNRNWTVLFIGGSSGTGKSSIAYEIARFYGVNVLEVDDVHLTVETVTAKENYPAIHYWDTGINWKDIGIDGNVKWLIDVSKEMIPVLEALVNRHLEDKLPIIIEGDFIYPEFTISFDNPEVKSFFINEPDINQIMQNFLLREGGDLQQYRAEISIAYGKWITNTCKRNNIRVLEARPWDTALVRAIESLHQ
jgi:2-phosphoglycerate kinase